jgi:GntR family transcriptional regulator
LDAQTDQSGATDTAAVGAEPGDLKRWLRSSEQPLYVSLAELLRREIHAGRCPVGIQLPTIDTLAAQYGLAKVTVRQALARLASDGLIERIQGKGTFVAASIAQHKPIELESSWQALVEAIDGNVPELLRVDPTCQDVPLRAEDGQPFGPYRYMRRLHRSLGLRYCVIDLYLALSCYQQAPQAFDTQMVIPLLDRLASPSIKKMTQSFRILTADIEVARFLGVPINAPIGEVRRVITDNDDRVLYLGIGQYRGDAVVFHTTIEAPGGAARVARRKIGRDRRLGE